VLPVGTRTKAEWNGLAYLELLRVFNDSKEWSR
jgi:hypothetical protein